MHFGLANFGLLAFAANAVTARPGYSPSTPLVKRAETWNNPDGGNTVITAGNGRINWGSTPPWDALDKIKENCPENGCHSKEEFKVPTTIIKDGEAHGADLIISVEGTFAGVGDPGNLDDLVEMAKKLSAASEGYTVESVKYGSGGSCQVAGFTPCQPPEPKEADQYEQTNLIIIRVEDEDEDFQADMAIHVSLEIIDPTEGWCDNIMTVGSAIVGAINGVAGGAFKLGSLFCD